MAIAITLVDDHSIVRLGVADIIRKQASSEMYIVGEASNGLDTLSINRQQSVDVFILDISMPGLDGIETAQRIMKENPEAKIILYTMYRDRWMIRRAFRAGIHGYALKESPAEELIDAIREVHRGNTFVSPIISQYAGDESSEQSPRYTPTDTLTNRQREILKLICDGLTERKIAKQLNISMNTVHVHKTNIMKKLDVHSKVGLIRYGMRERLIPPVL